MTSKVFSFMEKYKMIEEGDLVIIGVSGGADSLCLLTLLLEYRRRKLFYPAVVHVNHGLRQEAYREAEYVKSICEKNDLPFYPVEAEVRKIARNKKISEEEAGRILRYESFEEALQYFKKEEIKGEKIAVAHHGNDQAETLLFNLFRGTGIYGMAGIRPKRDKIIRPLLCLQRDEIEDYLKDKGIRWCNDASNDGDDYTRNKIRHHILTYAKEHINRRTIEHLSGTAMQMAELREYIQGEINKAKETCCVDSEEGISIFLPKFLFLPELIKKQMILEILSDILPGRKNIGSVHLNNIMELCSKNGTKEITLPFHLHVKKEYDNLIFFQIKEERNKEGSSGKEIEEVRLVPGKCYEIGEGRILEVSILKREDSFVIEENQYTKFLDYDKIKSYPSLRSRQTGDYITINDRGEKKKLKEFMIEEKIPKDKRNLIPIIAEGGHILWIVGYRISAYYKVSKETKNLMQMTIRRREEHGRES